jgi:N-acetylglutamate synthase-like GNAT family acetyltransferase
VKSVVNIRPYQPPDLPAIIEIFNLNTPTYFHPTEVHDLSEYLEKHGQTYLVCTENNIILGGAGYIIKREKSIGLVTWIFFHPDHAGRGLGSRVVKRCHTILLESPHVKKLMVNTSQHAYRFFARFGYNVVHVEKDYWAAGLDLYRMEAQI